MAASEPILSKRRTDLEGQVFLALGIALGALLILGNKAIYGVQGEIAALAAFVPLGYAYGAGMVASVNPCGVLLLPSLVAYYLGRNEGFNHSAWYRTRIALAFGFVATLGFVVLFALVGAIIALGGRLITEFFPLGGFLVGVALAGLALWLVLTGRGFGIMTASQVMGYVPLSVGLRSFFFFGVGYAIASLACTLPIFLVVAGSALATGGPLAAVGQLIGYALGMGTVLTIVVLGAAFFQSVVDRWLRRIVPYVHRLAASFLLGAGIFIMYYWLAAGGLFNNG